MAQHNSSSAFRFVSSELAAPAPQVEEKQNVKLRVVEHKRADRAADAITPRTVLMFFFVVGIICLMLFNQAQINEINDEIKDTNIAIQQMKSEYGQMHSILESEVSPRNVALQAEQELGLQIADQYQIEYISIYEDDQIKIIETGNPDSLSEQVETFVANIFQKIIGDEDNVS